MWVGGLKLSILKPHILKRRRRGSFPAEDVRGKILHTREHKSQIPLEHATEHPLDNSSQYKPTGQVTILWEIPLTSEIPSENATEHAFKHATENPRLFLRRRCMYVYTYVYVYVCIYIYIYMYMYTYIHTYIHTYILYTHTHIIFLVCNLLPLEVPRGRAHKGVRCSPAPRRGRRLGFH